MNENIVSLNDILDDSNVKEDNSNIVPLDEIINEKPKKDNDKLIEKIQIGLIIFLIISATLIYFFGYNFFEPYIKID